ncbi:MAG TPA: hypothetical protein VNA15_02755 [Candidatus Angelobacter sp.]|nr:hypothetical protein [Candidatus Angelobacter sp.]
MTPYLEDGSLRILDYYSTLAGDEKTGVKDPLDFTEVSIRISDIIEKATKKPATIILDSITPIFNSSQSKIAINFLRVLGAKSQEQRWGLHYDCHNGFILRGGQVKYRSDGRWCHPAQHST